MADAVSKKWEITKNLKGKTLPDIQKTLLKNRGLKTTKTQNEFFKPISPNDLNLETLGVKKGRIRKAISRIKLAKKNGQKVIIYGDYDVDGISATAILWETLNALGIDVIPYIPERFSEGYGLNSESIKKIKEKYSNLKLIISVDNGIVAVDAVNAATELKIDVIITDHHEKGEKYPKAYSIIHSTKISGSGVSWLFAKKIRDAFKAGDNKLPFGDGLELAFLGTIADQMPLVFENRSIAKFGLRKLSETKRPGLKALFDEAGIDTNKIGAYTVGFIIGPRLNAMGRLENAIESLRLLCVKAPARARELSLLLGKTNYKRQKILVEVNEKAALKLKKDVLGGVIVVDDSSFHEGVIGPAASRIVDKYWKPAIVISRGESVSKASARSIPGFNIIETLRKYSHLLDGVGGHSMAAGFSIPTKNIVKFTKSIGKDTAKTLSSKKFFRRLKIDAEIDFDQINWELMKLLKRFEPTGLGNPNPSFVTKRVDVLDARLVGRDKKHIKLSLKKGNMVFDAIAFGLGDIYKSINSTGTIDVAYNLDENYWNGNTNIQLLVKDIKV